jgi:rRNA maturation endonuclease Nob1
MVVKKSPIRLIEKNICKACGIVFKKADVCPRCGKGETLEIYLEEIGQS